MFYLGEREYERLRGLLWRLRQVATGYLGEMDRPMPATTLVNMHSGLGRIKNKLIDDEQAFEVAKRIRGDDSLRSQIARSNELIAALKTAIEAAVNFSDDGTVQERRFTDGVAEFKMVADLDDVRQATEAIIAVIEE